jgi:hypothetical protein
METCLFATVAQQQLWNISLSRGRYPHATIYFTKIPYTSGFLYYRLNIQGLLITFLAMDYKPAKILQTPSLYLYQSFCGVSRSIS